MSVVAGAIGTEAGGGCPGRVEIDDVAPVVSCEAYIPLKAVVGEGGPDGGLA